MRMTLAVLAVLASVVGSAASATAATDPGAHAAGSVTKATLYDVGCLSASHCFAVGAAGTLLATTNGGGTWHREASPAGAVPLYRIACVAPASCYVIARPATILVTHDAGMKWTAQTFPVQGSGLALAKCEVGDGTNPQPDASCRLGLLDVACPRAQTCYVVATGSGGWNVNPRTRKSGPGSSLWLTRNGGVTWVRQPIPSGVACNGDCSPSNRYGYPLEWVSCRPSGPCWAGGNQLIGSHEGFAAAWLMTKTLGGSWRLEPGCAAGTCSEPVTDLGACPTGNSCYAVNNSSPFGGGSSVSNYTATGQNGPSVTAPNGLFISDIACPGARTCYAVGAHGVVLSTVNGTKFTRVKPSARANLNGITCVSTSVCFAVGAAGLIETIHEE